MTTDSKWIQKKKNPLVTTPNARTSDPSLGFDVRNAPPSGSSESSVPQPAASVNQTKAVLDRGGTNEQAIASGFAAGAAEMLFEKFSVEELLAQKSVTGWKSWLRETVKQAGVEASEETLTEIANILSDAAIMGGNSDFARNVAGYMAEGMSREDAERKAFLDCVGQVGLAGLGGAVSGGVMGGTVNAVNGVRNAGSRTIMDDVMDNLLGPLETTGSKAETPEPPAAGTPDTSVIEDLLNNIMGPREQKAQGPDTVTFQEDPIIQNVLDMAIGPRESAPAVVETAEGQKNSAQKGGESTSINTDSEGHAEAEIKTINEYRSSVDNSVVEFIKKWRTLKNPNYKKSIKISVAEVTHRAIQDVKQITGVDVTGFDHALSGNALEHIEQRHGENGEQDHTMADDNDIARIGYVLENYDTVELLRHKKSGEPVLSKEYVNADNTPAKTVIFKKKIDGTYYIVEAVPDTKAHQLRVISAYMGKTSKSTDQVLNIPSNGPQLTPEAPHGANTLATSTVPQPAPNVNHEPVEQSAPGGEDAHLRGIGADLTPEERRRYEELAREFEFRRLSEREQSAPGRADRQNNNAPEGGENVRLTDADVSEYMNTGKRQSVRNAKQEMLNSGNSPVLTTIKQVKEFIVDAIKGKRLGETKAYGKVGRRLADAVKAKAPNISIDGYYMELVTDELKHAYDNHSNPKQKGDIALTDADFENLPDYIDAFDDVLSVEKYNDKVKIRLSKQINGKDYIIVLETVSSGRKSVHPQDVIGISSDKFAEKYGGRIVGSQRAETEISEQPNTSPHTDYNSSATPSIPQPAHNVNHESAEQTAPGTDAAKAYHNIGADLTPEERRRYEEFAREFEFRRLPEREQSAHGGAEGQKNNAPEGGNGLIPISENMRQSLSTGKNNFIAHTAADIVSFVKTALRKKGGPGRLYMGTFPKATSRFVKEATGIDVTGYAAILPESSILHIFNHHGNEKIESARGQKAVTAEDISLIPQVLAHPNSVELSSDTDADGRQVLLFKKQIGDRLIFITAQGVTDGRHALTTDSMWVQKKKNPLVTTPNAGITTAPGENVRNAPPSGSSESSVSHPAASVNHEPVEQSAPGGEDAQFRDIGADLTPEERRRYEEFAREFEFRRLPEREQRRRKVEHEAGFFMDELQERMGVEKGGESVIIGNNRFYTKDDPMRDVIGSAETSHPQETQQLKNHLRDIGVEIIRPNHEKYGYQPGTSVGKPGIVSLCEGASYSAWLHEIKHADDDMEDGWLGFRVFSDIKKCVKREMDAYQIEIDLANSLGYPETAERLEELRDEEIGRIRGDRR